MPTIERVPATLRSWNGRSGKASREAALVKTGGCSPNWRWGGKQRAGTGTDQSLPAEWILNGTGVLSDSSVHYVTSAIARCPHHVYTRLGWTFAYV